MSCSRKPSGSNHGSASRSSTSSRVHAPCSGWPGERPVVHAQPGVLVLAETNVRSASPSVVGRDLGFDRQRAAQLEQLPLLAEPMPAGHARLRGSGVVRRPVHDPTAVGLCHGERGTDHAESSSRRGSAPGSRSTSTLQVSLPRSARATRGVDLRRHERSRSAGRRRLVGRCRSAPRSEAKGSIPSSAMARPRTPKGRALETERRLAEEYPDAAVRARLPQPVRASGGHDPVGPDAPTSG